MFSKIALIAALAAPLIAAQDLSGLPSCAETPAIAALGSTGCSITDIACICKDSAFLTSLEPAVAAACSPADLATALQFAVDLCDSVGVTLTISTPAATSPAATSTPTPASTTAAPSSTPASTTPAITSAAATSTLATVTTIVPPVSEFTDGQPQGPTNATTVALPTVTPFKGAADSNKAQGAIVGLLAAVGVFVAL